MQVEAVYSNDDEMYFEDFDSIAYNMEVGDTYYEAEKVHIKPENCVDGYDIDNFLNCLDESLYDRINLEDMDDCFQDVSKEAKQELLDLVKEWAGKHVKIPYWNVTNVVEKVATQEDLV